MPADRRADRRADPQSAGVTDKSLEQLEGDIWPDANPDDTYVIRTCTALRRMPLRDFGPEQLRIMIGQGIGLPYLVPIALEALAKNPLAEGDFYPGDLLAQVRRVDQSYWDDHPDQAAALAGIVSTLA